MKIFKILWILLFFALVISGCKNQQKKIDEGFRFDEGQQLKEIEITKSFIYLFPAPGEVLDRFYEADLQYLSDFLHDPAQADAYLTARDQALNLGVYLSDMAYSALFSRNSEATEYLDVIRDLSGDLNVSTSVFETLTERAKNNIANRDSLLAISNEAYFEMMEFLENSGEETTLAVITAGAYIEAMYLAINAVEEFSEDDPVITQIAEMKYPLENLMGMTGQESEDPHVQSILEFMKELEGIFGKLEKEAVTSEVVEPGVINLTGGDLPDLNEQNFDEVKQKVIMIREQIVAK